MGSIDHLEIIGRLFSESHSDKDKNTLRFAADAIRFILSTGHEGDFEAYIRSLDASGPPLVIARFDTREEADQAMNTRVPPVRQAYVLIGDDYYSAMFVPSLGQTRLVFMPPTLEHYLQEMADKQLTPSGLSFATKAEAEAWMHQQPTPPQQVLVDVAGAPYLAAYHHRIDHRVLYPLPPPTSPSQEA
jgi:hypothetical protein